VIVLCHRHGDDGSFVREQRECLHLAEAAYVTVGQDLGQALTGPFRPSRRIINDETPARARQTAVDVNLDNVRIDEGEATIVGRAVGTGHLHPPRLQRINISEDDINVALDEQFETLAAILHSDDLKWNALIGGELPGRLTDARILRNQDTRPGIGHGSVPVAPSRSIDAFLLLN